MLIIMVKIITFYGPAAKKIKDKLEFGERWKLSQDIAAWRQETQAQINKRHAKMDRKNRKK